ncbi:MAG: GGDEF domain-containing protein [Treponema sp.]|jgi:diguanylate cyclase (GGDEF)-like protein|nr:GGDEF domain-containing protein [Treponema sp.]
MSKQNTIKANKTLGFSAELDALEPSPVHPALEHIWKLLKEKDPPSLSPDLAHIPLLEAIHHELLALRGMAESLQSEVNQRNSTVIALQQREYRFRFLAAHDALTGAMNRTSFMERTNRELNSALATRTTCGVVMMDIDYFKCFNDTWGHLAGDEALRFVVKVIAAILRKNDFVGRYGGEEFVFFFNGADMETSVAIAERIRETIASTPINLESGPVYISASFGVAVTSADFEGPVGDEYIDRIINNADMAMYQAKKTGRNRVVAFSDDDTP